MSDITNAMQIVKQVLTTDFACPPGVFDKEGVFIYLAREMAGARQFSHRKNIDKILSLATTGTGVVINCNAGRRRWVQTNLGSLNRNDLFSAPVVTRITNYLARDGQLLMGPVLAHICTRKTFRPFSGREDMEINLIEGENILSYFENNRFPNALGRNDNPERPRVMACLAKYHGNVAGLAAVSADCDTMWQIGIDIFAEYRQHGIGKALVSRLTDAVLEIGKIPYYSTAVANLASRRIAIGLGYRPAWVEMYSKDRE